MLSFFTSFAYIGLKSMQQLHVVHKQYWWIPPTSLLMALCEVYIVRTTAHTTEFGWLVLCIGLGGGLGSVCATYLHDRVMKK